MMPVVSYCLPDRLMCTSCDDNFTRCILALLICTSRNNCSLAAISLSLYPLNVPTHLFHSFPLSKNTTKRLLHSSVRYNPYWWFAETSPSPSKGWIRLGAGAVVLHRTTISYLSTASKATSESALLCLHPATASLVRWNQSATWWLNNWVQPELPSLDSDSTSFPPSVDLILSAISSNLLSREKGVHVRPYFLVLNEVWLPLVYFFKVVLVWSTVWFCFLVFVLSVLFGCQSKSAFSSKPRLVSV